MSIHSAVDPSGRPVPRDRVEAASVVARNADAERTAQTSPAVNAGQPQPTSQPLVRTVDLAVGESQSVALADGKTATVKLLGVDEVRDPIRSAVREAKVKVEVNGTPVTLTSGNYQLPVPAGGVQFDCPITGGYRTNSNHDPWGLVKDARIRLWPAGSPWIEPTAFVYPARQRWFASSTQMANEPVYVDGGEKPAVKKIYYHNGLDISGAEGLVEVVSATDGDGRHRRHRPRGLAARTAPSDPGTTSSTCSTTRDGITRYEPPAIDRPGDQAGDGRADGPEDRRPRQGRGQRRLVASPLRDHEPAALGRWGTQEGYAFLWQAYLREQKPEVVAVARPHRFARTGEPVVLDGSKSWSRSGPVARFEWTFSDGTTASGPKSRADVRPPGLLQRGPQGHRPGRARRLRFRHRPSARPLEARIRSRRRSTRHMRPRSASSPATRSRSRCGPSGRPTAMRPGTSATAPRPSTSTRTATSTVHAKDGYAVTTHRFEKPGHYLVRVERTDRRGATATARLHVVVESER